MLVPDDPDAPFAIEVRIWDAEGALVNEDGDQHRAHDRSFEELAGWCVRENPVPHGRAAHRHGRRAAGRRRAGARPARRGRVEGIGALANPVRAASAGAGRRMPAARPAAVGWPAARRGSSAGGCGRRTGGSGISGGTASISTFMPGTGSS